jgi:hypothetical protein
METETKENGFKPATKVVVVKPVMRMRNPMVSDPDHEAYFLFGSSTIHYCLPVDKNNNLINPFTSKDEQLWLEKALDADLNIYKKENNFWLKHKVKLGKDERKLNLANPKDYIDYLILKANSLYIAPDGESQQKKRTYRYALVSEEFETQTKVKASDKKKMAYKAAAKLEEKGKTAMLNFLKVYGHRVSEESKPEFLVAAIDDIIEENIDGFLAIVADKEYETKLLIANAVELGAVVKKGRLYTLPGGDNLCGPGEQPTIDKAVSYLNSPRNSDILASLHAKVEGKKS